MSVNTENRNTDGQIEDQLRKALATRARTVGAVPDSEAAWQRSRSAKLRPPRNRLAIGASLLAGVVGVIATAVVINRREANEHQVRVTEIPIDDLRLVPSPLVPGARYSIGSKSVSETSAATIVWRNDSQMIVLRSSWYSAAMANGRLTDLDEALGEARSTGREIGGTLWWQTPLRTLSLSAAPPVKASEMERLARSVVFDADGNVAGMATPLGLSKVFDGASSLLEPERWWSITFDSGDQLAAGLSIRSVYAQRPSALADSLGTDGTDLSQLGLVGRTRSVRRTIGKVIEGDRVNSLGKPVGKSTLLQWRERGWIVSVTAESEAAAVSMAESLREPTEEEWYDLVTRFEFDVPIIERRKALRTAAAVDVLNDKVVVRVAEVTTQGGCVNIAVQYQSGESGSSLKQADDRMCLEPSGPDLAWSGIRTLAGRPVVVAIVRVNADSALLTQDPGPPVTATGSPAELGVSPIQPEGIVFDTLPVGSTGWLGLVVLPFDGESPGRIELFSDTNFDRSAPSPEPSEAEPVADLDSESEYQPMLRSLGRFEVGR